MSGGRFSKEKGQLYFVKAAEIALKENENIRFVLFGDGPDLQKIKSYISDKKLENYIVCPGFESNLLGYLKYADILVNPSLSEGLPNIVLEALASNVPVILTNVGGHPEIITDNKNGFLVEPKNIDNLAERIVKLSQDKKIRDEFIKNSHEVLRDKFTFESQNKKLINLYNKIGRA